MWYYVTDTLLVLLFDAAQLSHYGSEEWSLLRVIVHALWDKISQFTDAGSDQSTAHLVESLFLFMHKQMLD